MCMQEFFEEGGGGERDLWKPWSRPHKCIRPKSHSSVLRENSQYDVCTNGLLPCTLCVAYQVEGEGRWPWNFERGRGGGEIPPAHVEKPWYVYVHACWLYGSVRNIIPSHNITGNSDVQVGSNIDFSKGLSALSGYMYHPPNSNIFCEGESLIYIRHTLYIHVHGYNIMCKYACMYMHYYIMTHTSTSPL